MADSPDTVTQTGDQDHPGWRMMLHEIMNNIHDRINFGTKVRRDATVEASEDPSAPPKGFKALKNVKE